MRPSRRPQRLTRHRLAPAPTGTTCAVCRAPVTAGDDAACERCGLPLHFVRCWLERVATPAERTAWWRGDEAAVARLVVSCPGCRS
jgi:hypothetical protein